MEMGGSKTPSGNSSQVPVNDMLDNQYVYEPFWKHVNGVPGFDNWEASASKRHAGNKPGSRRSEGPTFCWKSCSIVSTC